MKPVGGRRSAAAVIAVLVAGVVLLVLIPGPPSDQRVQAGQSTEPSRPPFESLAEEQLAFAASYVDEFGAYRSGLFVVNGDGTGFRKVTDSTGTWSEGAAWSPDGTHIAFADGCG